MAQAGAVAPAARGPERAVRVLLVIGDKPLANTIDLTLRHGRYLRRIAETVNDAKAGIGEWKPHLLVVDIDTEAGGAIRVIDEARNHRPPGIIPLTRRSDLRGKLDPFERGAGHHNGIPFVPADRAAPPQAAIPPAHGAA